MHPKRRRKNSMRLQGWNYKAAGYYFLTFCTHQRKCLFTAEAVVTYLEKTWLKLPTWKGMHHFHIDEFVIMPNHIHALLWIMKSEVRHDSQKSNKVEPGSASAAVGAFKSTASLKLKNQFRFDPDGKIWQRGFYDRIIRNERELNATREYIRLNPVRWVEDRDNWGELISRMTYHLE